MKTVIVGSSAHGKSRLLIGPYYYFSYGSMALPEMIMESPLPTELAWTKMNTGWSHKRK